MAMSGDLGGGSICVSGFSCHLIFGAASSPESVRGNSKTLVCRLVLSTAEACNSSNVGCRTAESVQFHSDARSASHGEDSTCRVRSGKGLYQYQVLYPPAARIRNPRTTGRFVVSGTLEGFFLLMIDWMLDVGLLHPCSETIPSQVRHRL
jgi:hypothetical protein